VKYHSSNYKQTYLLVGELK